MNESNPKPREEYKQARESLQRSLSWYSSFRRHHKYRPDVEVQAAVRQDLQALKSALDKLDRKVIKIAAFGLVSRGKSAVVNALLGQKILTTGPLHGVTQYPRSIPWTIPNCEMAIELIDTPGLDEIEGQARAKMARDVAYEADLILFIVAGDVTRTEYEALSNLHQIEKPLILVFNKIDLYPDTDREEIYRQLQELSQGNNAYFPDEIALVSAEPQPVQVRIEFPGGQVKTEWEESPPQIEELQKMITKIISQEGNTLLAISALFQAKKAQENIAKKTIELREKEAEEIIWKYAKYKAIAVGINPVFFLDILGGAITDFALINSLAKLYGLPITNYQAGKLWRQIFVSSGSLLLGELAIGAVLGVGKSATAIIGAFENPGAFTAYSGAAISQGAIAGYGAYAVGKAAQKYLEQGCSWGSFGAKTAIKNILDRTDPDTIIYRLQQELRENL
ncbi:MAG: DUF697 domain-containing protein [Prochloraceae cyanobacterium]|nr:DUF697 domain-containing protein [Prochloraceae cyanobacterium]